MTDDVFALFNPFAVERVASRRIELAKGQAIDVSALRCVDVWSVFVELRLAPECHNEQRPALPIHDDIRSSAGLVLPPTDIADVVSIAKALIADGSHGASSRYVALTCIEIVSAGGAWVVRIGRHEGSIDVPFDATDAVLSALDAMAKAADAALAQHIHAWCAVNAQFPSAES